MSPRQKWLAIAFLLACLERIESRGQETQTGSLPRLLRMEEEKSFSEHQSSLKHRATKAHSHRALEIDVEGTVFRNGDGVLKDAMFENSASEEGDAQGIEKPMRIYIKDTFVDVEDGQNSSSSPHKLMYKPVSASSEGLCMTVANTTHVLNSRVVLKKCVNNTDELFETPRHNKSGVIRWAKDKTKCLHPSQSWLGNGVHIVMNDCSKAALKDKALKQNMTFYHVREATTGFSQYWWTYDKKKVPARVLEINSHDQQFLKDGQPVVLWDASCGADWKEVP